MFISTSKCAALRQAERPCRSTICGELKIFDNEQIPGFWYANLSHGTSGERSCSKYFATHHRTLRLVLVGSSPTSLKGAEIDRAQGMNHHLSVLCFVFNFKNLRAISFCDSFGKTHQACTAARPLSSQSQSRQAVKQKRATGVHFGLCCVTNIASH